MGFGVMPKGHVSNVGVVGGMNGIAPNIPNANASTPAVFNAVDIAILSLPGMMAKRQTWCRNMKTILETCGSSITGIDFGLTMNGQDVAGGFDGQKRKMPTYPTISQPAPTWKIPELLGNLVWNSVRMWLTEINHPHTNAGYSRAIKDFGIKNLPPHVWSTFSMTMMVIQRDNSGHSSRIMEAALYTAMWPEATGDLGLERNMEASSKIIERDLKFNSVVICNDSTRKLGYNVAEYLDATGVNFDASPVGVSSVSDNLKDMGIERQLKELREESAEGIA
jgi:hypothetical protein